MHSIAVASVLAAAAAVVTAAPTINQARGAYYVCYNNGFKGDCSVDPCALSWCPDYKPYTYEKAVVVETPVATPQQPAPVTSSPQWYICANNGFRGSCSVDPCALSWCPDYKPYTYEPLAPAARRSDASVCAAGTGYYQVCANGFAGCCKGDACGSSWCPDYKYGTFEPVGSTTPLETEPLTSTPAPVTVSTTTGGDQTVCPAGAGYYQVCASGFKGCCKTDACAKGYCAA